MFPTLIRIGDFRLATYGVLVAAGYFAAIFWLSRRRERMGLSEKDFWGVVYAVFFGAILGGKILYWLVEWRSLADGTLRPLRDFRYGFVFFGGFLGSSLAGWAYRRRHPFDFLRVADYFAAALPIGHAIGRLGCFMAGCCAGKPTSLPWGVRFTHPESLVDPGLAGMALHPTQLYEAAADLLIAGVLMAMLRSRPKEAASGRVLAAYACLYGGARFAIEFLRGDDRGGALLGLSVSQWIGLGCAVAGAVFWVRGGKERS